MVVGVTGSGTSDFDLVTVGTVLSLAKSDLREPSTCRGDVGKWPETAALCVQARIVRIRLTREREGLSRADTTGPMPRSGSKRPVGLVRLKAFETWALLVL